MKSYLLKQWCLVVDISTSTFIIPAVLIVAMYFHVMLGVINFGIAYDEIFHVPDGYATVETGERKLKIAHPPLGMYFAGVSLKLIKPTFDLNYYLNDPNDRVKFGNNFFFEGIHSTQFLLFVARFFYPLFAVVLVAYCYLLSRTLYGQKFALATLLLSSFCTSLIGWSRFVYLDVPLATLMFASVAHLFWFGSSRSLSHLVISGITFGLALCVKYSAVAILPFIVVVPFLFMYFPGQNTRPKMIVKDYLYVFFHLFLASFVVWLIFGSPNDIGFYYSKMREIYWDMDTGFKFYLMGDFKEKGWWYYFLVNLVIKSSLATILLLSVGIASIIIALVNLFRMNKEERFFVIKFLFLIIPALLFFIATSIKALPLGSRYNIPLYPFIYTLCAYGLMVVFSFKSVIIKSIAVILIITHVIRSILIFPDQMAYFNELIGSPENGILWVEDSSIDAGQNLPRLAKYLRSEKNNSPVKILYHGTDKPENYGIKTLITSQKDWDGPPSPGLYAISARWLVYGQKDAQENKKHIDWLKAYKPIKVIGGSIWIYEFD